MKAKPLKDKRQYYTKIGQKVYYYEEDDVKLAIEYLKKELWTRLGLSHGFYPGDQEDIILKTIKDAFPDAMEDKEGE